MFEENHLQANTLAEIVFTEHLSDHLKSENLVKNPKLFVNHLQIIICKQEYNDCVKWITAFLLAASQVYETYTTDVWISQAVQRL